MFGLDTINQINKDARLAEALTRTTADQQTRTLAQPSTLTDALDALRVARADADALEEALWGHSDEGDDACVNAQELRDKEEQRLALARIIEQIVKDQRDRVGLDFDRYWARDLLDLVDINGGSE